MTIEYDITRDITNAEAYDPVFSVTTESQAAAHIAALVAHGLARGHWPSEEEGRRIVLSNVGYWAGYGDHESRVRVERLYGTLHPVFGRAAAHEPTIGEAFIAGVKVGAATKPDTAKLCRVGQMTGGTNDDR